MIALSVSAQNKLQLGQTSQIKIQNEAYQTEISLEAGRLIEVQITVTLDSTYKVFEPNGNLLTDSKFWRMGTYLKLFFITKEKGNYKIEGKNDYFTPKVQQIELRIDDLRAANENDSKIIELQNLRREAKNLENKKDEESKKLFAGKNTSALNLAKELKDKIGEGEILANIGYWEGLKSKEKGAEIINQANEIFEQLQDNSRLTHGYFLLGLNYFSQFGASSQGAIKPYQRCVETGEKLKIDVFIGSCLINLGAAYQSLGEYGSSAPFFERALLVFEKYGIRGGVITALSNLIVLNTALGNVQQSLKFYAQYNEVISIYQLNDDCNLGLTSGLLQYNLQNWKTAREIFKTSRIGCLSGKRSVNSNLNLENAALALVGEGATYTGEGETEKALPILNAALQESRNVKSKLAEATALGAIGIYYDSINDSSNALKFLEEAKLILIELKQPTLLNIVLTVIGKNQLQNGNFEKSEAAFQELLERSRKIQYAKQEAAAFFGLAQVADKKGDLAAARKNIEDSIKIIESNRGRIPTDALRVAFFASVANYYDFYTDLLMRLHVKNPDGDFNKLAFQAAESSDARSLLNQLQETGINIRAGVSPELIAEEKRLREELNAQNAAQLKMLTTFAFPAQLEKVRNDISRLSAEYEQTQAQIFASSPSFAALTQPKPLSLDEIQKQLDAKTVLLKYSLGEEKSYLFVVTADSFKTFELPQKAEIEAKIWSFRQLLTVREQISNITEIKNADAKLIGESAALSEILLGKVGNLSDKRLAVIPSGALQFVPFAALQNPNIKGQYLIQSNEITILPSASVLAVQRQEKRNAPTKTLALFADPVYEKDDPRLLKAKEMSKVSAKSETRGNEVANLLNLDGGLPKSFQRLIYSRREANQILSLVGNEKQKFAALDFNANYKSATDQNLQDFRFLHFAAHGIFNAQNPQFSGVVLSLLNEKGESENGLLSLQDVYNLRLNSDLVVLSACRTGLGKQVKGEGVVGLTRGFMYAGSRRVVASLWKVQDDATAELMTEFYKNILRDGKRPAEAMRLAQISMLKKNQYSSPFFWAAFVHYGEWQ